MSRRLRILHTMYTMLALRRVVWSMSMPGVPPPPPSAGCLNGRCIQYFEYEIRPRGGIHSRWDSTVSYLSHNMTVVYSSYFGSSCATLHSFLQRYGVLSQCIRGRRTSRLLHSPCHLVCGVWQNQRFTSMRFMQVKAWKRWLVPSLVHSVHLQARRVRPLWQTCHRGGRPDSHHRFCLHPLRLLHQTQAAGESVRIPQRSFLRDYPSNHFCTLSLGHRDPASLVYRASGGPSIL